ncbi:MAG: hypothetical protein K2G40_08255, partial [Muribaculaceae bacterium]|nr:hypothetical protein [Muribaculaceae bacterium]
MRILYSILLSISIFSVHLVHGYNLRQTYNVEGLPNSAIMSMSADNDGLLWMGTCDGVSIFDGLDVTQFQDMYPGVVLSGNVIENIMHTPNGKTWIQTNHGLDLFDHNTGTIITYPEFGGIQLITINDKGDLLLLSTGGMLYSYEYGPDGGFKEIAPIDINTGDILAISAQEDNLIIITKRGVFSCNLKYDTKNKTYTLVDVSKGFIDKIDYAAVDNKSIKAVNGRGTLGRIKADATFEPIVHLGGKIREYGDISDIITDGEGNIYISFFTNGIVRVGSDEHGLTIDEMDTDVGVFCLESSDSQPVVWIGTDCQGLLTLSNSDYNIRSYDFNDLNNLISHPIRSLYLDSDSTLWIGTKGSGILCIENFSEHNQGKITGNLKQFKKENSLLHHNSVFVFEPSHGPIMWIGTDQGLNYYDFNSRELKSIPSHEYLKYIHDIYETDDKTLLLSTLRGGLIKATIEGTASDPVLTDITQYVIDNGDKRSNFFFSISNIPGQGIILSNRGKGVFKFENDHLIPIKLHDNYTNQSTYDVFATAGDANTLWLGTSNGLLRKDADSEVLFNGIDNGFSNNTIHEIIRDKDGELWIATNKGIVRFNT